MLSFKPTLRWIILIAIINIVAITVLIGLAESFRKNLASLLVERSLDSAQKRVEHLFQTPEEMLQLLHDWGVNQQLSLSSKTALLNARLQPILGRLPQASGVLLADTDGREFMLMREETGWLSRRTNKVEWGDKKQWSSWNEAGQLIKTWSQTNAYDPRQRPWFQMAGQHAGDRKIYWTKPYQFYTAEKLGITAATSWKNDNTKKINVVAIDVLWSKLLTFIAEIEEREKVRLIAITAEGMIHTQSSKKVSSEVVAEKGIFSQHVTESNFPGLVSAYESWIANPGKKSLDTQRMNLQGDYWWSGVRVVHLHPKNILLVAAVQESGLITTIGRHRPLLVLGIVDVVALLALIVISVVYALKIIPRIYSQQIMSREDVQRIIGNGEQDKIEFKQTLRWNVSGNKKGFEIEVASLKTMVAFLNSDGGLLLVGVRDDGQITGIEEDQFENHDKLLLHLQNLIHQHIGLEFIRYIHYGLVPMGDKHVLVIRCETSRQPAFLKTGKEESFYVRIGPASRKLSASKMVHYIQSQKT